MEIGKRKGEGKEKGEGKGKGKGEGNHTEECSKLKLERIGRERAEGGWEGWESASLIDIVGDTESVGSPPQTSASRLVAGAAALAARFLRR